jgi:hypothetical protein
VRAPAGSVVFTHCGVLHAGSANCTRRTRYFVSCYLNRVGLPVRDIQQGELVEKTAATAARHRNRRVLRLLGKEEPLDWMRREEAMWGREVERERAAMASRL